MTLPPGAVKNVVVTGGSSGIGRSIVEAFCGESHRVLFTYLRHAEAAARLVERYPTATAVRCDQGDLRSVVALHDDVARWLDGQPLDVLVNNAALGSQTVLTYENLRDNDAREHLDAGSRGAHIQQLLSKACRDEALMRVNALGPLWVSDALIPLMSGPTRAVVVMVGSVGGSSGAVFPEYHPSDLMSKAAVAYLTQHLAADLIRSHVDVVCVSPGATDTDMMRASMTNKELAMPMTRGMLAKGRLIDPREIADVIYWICTQAQARVFHGAVLDASMGLACRPGLQTERPSYSANNASPTRTSEPET
ncbi:short chain dehydrogenase [Plasmodiophora brassicae]